MKSQKGIVVEDDGKTKKELKIVIGLTILDLILIVVLLGAFAYMIN